MSFKQEYVGQYSKYLLYVIADVTSIKYFAWIFCEYLFILDVKLNLYIYIYTLFQNTRHYEDVVPEFQQNADIVKQITYILSFWLTF